MIRLLLGSALPVLGLGLAAATFGPTLMAGPRGAPLIMSSAEEVGVQAASFNGTACPSKLLFADGASTDSATGTHIFAFALHSGAKDVAVEVEDFAGAKKTPKTIVLVFDDHGRLLAAGDPAKLHVKVAAAASNCAEAAAPDFGAPI